MGFLSRFRRSLLKRFGPTAGRRHVAVLAERPLALQIFLGQKLEPLLRALARRDVLFCVRFLWAFDRADKVAELAQRLQVERRRRPGHRYLFCCDTPAQRDLLRAAGLDAIHSGQNAMIDERIFDLRPEVERRYDAIYDAQLAAFKRHALAARVPSLALISYIDPVRYKKHVGEDARRALPHAHWLNDPLAPGWRRLAPREVAEALVQARVGLCLSAEEGAMFASTQYLLCGLPVVSTPSTGGRDDWYEPAFARIVPPEAEAVAAAVADFVRAPPPPTLVRERTLARLHAQRATLFERLDAWRAQAGVTSPYAEEFPRWYFHTMFRAHPLRQIVKALRGPSVLPPLLPPPRSQATREPGAR